MEKKENESSTGKNKKKRGAGFVIRMIILGAAAAVFFFAAYQLYDIYHTYQTAGDEYESLKDTYTTPYSASSSEASVSSAPSASSSSSSASSATDSSGESNLVEDANPPLTVNFAALQQVNKDVVGWLYVDALPNISYPICHGTDNEYYLHHTFENKYLFAGSIFEDFNNSPDFSDPNTIVYGHNMKNQSMFGLLKFLRDQATYDKNPFFWIETPKGTYRYHIFAAMETENMSDAYYLYESNGPEFLKWEQEMQNLSEVKNTVRLSENDKVVMLSTCTSDSSRRCVVLGKVVSSQRPGD